MSDGSLPSIEGMATFEWVEVGVKEDYSTATVHGYYDGSTTGYQCDIDRLRIGGMKLQQAFDSFKLEPVDGNNWVWVEATEDELRITAEKPDNE